jgi:hypothetical protein
LFIILYPFASNHHHHQHQSFTTPKDTKMAGAKRMSAEEKRKVILE